MPDMMPPAGGPPPNPMASIAGGPSMPGSPAGGPMGPGSSPMATPAAGAGNEAAADGMVKAMIPGLHKALSAYQIGSKKYASVLNAIRALTSNFGKENQQSLVPSAIMQMAQAARGGTGGMPPSPAPPIAPGPMGDEPPGPTPMPPM